MRWTIRHSESKTIAAGVCTRCEASVTCNPRPASNDIDIGGDAVAVNCTERTPHAPRKSWITEDGSVRYLHDLDPAHQLIDRPLPWQLAGLQQTASGYGAKPTSTRCVKLSDGRTRRVYVTQYSNAGTAWIELDGTRYVIA